MELEVPTNKMEEKELFGEIKPLIEEYKEYAKRMGAERVLYLKSEDNVEEWNVGQHF